MAFFGIFEEKNCRETRLVHSRCAKKSRSSNIPRYLRKNQVEFSSTTEGGGEKPFSHFPRLFFKSGISRQEVKNRRRQVAKGGKSSNFPCFQDSVSFSRLSTMMASPRREFDKKCKKVKQTLQNGKEPTGFTFHLRKWPRLCLEELR